MADDVRRYIYGALIVFVVGVSVWIGFIFVSACGFSLTCNQGQIPVQRTPIPTLLPATLPVGDLQAGEGMESNQCGVPAVDLIGAWVEIGAPESGTFQFTDINGRICEAAFTDIKPLFVEANFWYPGSISCVSCHSVDVAISPAQLDLSSYQGIMAGSRRADNQSKGTDILGGGKWENSLLYEFLSAGKAEIPGHSEAISDLVIFAGSPLPVPEPPALMEATTPAPSP